MKRDVGLWPLARRFVPPLVVALGLMTAFSCTFTTSLDNLTNGQCPAGQKACNSKCVLASDPNYGCAAPGQCTPCFYANAVDSCDLRGACAIASCNGTFQDCNGIVADGCEIDIGHDPNNCGKCGTVCPSVPNGTPGCDAKHCTVGACNAGFADCNGVLTDGCETATNTRQNCGQCGPCTGADTCVCDGGAEPGDGGGSDAGGSSQSPTSCSCKVM